MGTAEARRVDDGERALLDGLVRAIAAFRWAAWAWMAVVAAIDLRNGPVAHPAVMVSLVALALGVTVAATVLARLDPAKLLGTPAIAVELVVAVALVGLDHWVYGADSIHAQSLGVVWPLAAVLTAGVRFGAAGGGLTGLAVGVATWMGELAVVPGRWYGDRILGSLGSVVLYVLGGAVAGVTAARLREAQRQIAMARAREEVARTLHDGVLQTLAVIQRRSDDADLVALAREQERDLRGFLAAPLGAEGHEDLGAGLRRAAGRVERTHGLRTEVVLAPDLPEVDSGTVAAIVGAAGEALTNAAKHGGATHATVFVDVDLDDQDLVCCSVKDDGSGFDPATHVEGTGLRRSVRGRLAEVGGRAEVDGRPGRGAEVRLYAPAALRRTLVPPGGDR